jgi:hypothetical protein
MLRGRGFFRTAYYFPSVTSSVAITVLWLFLFSGERRRQRRALLVRHQRPELVQRPARHPHSWLLGVFGLDSGPGRAHAGRAPARRLLVGLARRTLRRDERIHLHGRLHHLWHVHAHLPRRPFRTSAATSTEAAMMDGANGWQRFWRITLPQLRPTLFTVLTLGLIGCWQVFDQIYTGTRGAPEQDHAHAGLPVVPDRVPEPGVGSGCGDRVHPVRHHRAHHLHPPAALGATHRRERRAGSRRAPHPRLLRREIAQAKGGSEVVVLRRCLSAKQRPSWQIAPPALRGADRSSRSSRRSTSIRSSSRSRPASRPMRMRRASGITLIPQTSGPSRPTNGSSATPTSRPGS